MGKSSGIGGQAVLEGIMMKHKDRYAVAVRKPDNDIEIDVQEYKGLQSKSPLFRVPFIRGIFGFVESLVLGIKTLTYSASFIEDEIEEKEKVADKVAKKASAKGQSQSLWDLLCFCRCVFLWRFLLCFRIYCRI